MKRSTERWLLVVLLLACTKPSAPPASQPPNPRYYVVGRTPTQTLGRDSRRLLPGFGVVIVEQTLRGNDLVGRTSLGRQVMMKDLRPVTPSQFAGARVDERGLLFGWVVKENAPVYSQADTGSKIVARRPRYARMPLGSRDGPQGFYRVGEGWMADCDLRVPSPAVRPVEVASDEPWVDVELASQTLVAYEGNRPVFATLVATGVGAQGSAFATPRGLHRINAKLVTTTMDNLSHTDVVPYSYEEVPFTQYIGRVALHGAFWHDQFGAPRSHGCINLSLADAEWLFAFTRPTLPEGAREAAASAQRPGTVVRVR